MNIECLKYASVPVDLNIKEGDRVLILTDTKVEKEVYESLAASVYFKKGVPNIIIGAAPDAFGAEPSEMAANAILSADVLIGACSTSITHTDAVRKGLGDGLRYVAMGGVNIEALTNGASTADYDEVLETTEKVAEKLTQTSRVRVTSQYGTDITFSIENRPGFPLAGVFRPGTIACFPDGEAACAPVEGTAEGLLVVDTSMHHIGNCETPIELTVEKGKVVKIEGGAEADKLKKLLKEKGDKDSYNIGEFAIGTNKAARVTGNPQEDKKAYGSVHIAVGDNRTLAGEVRSSLHLDGLLLKPTVELDGKEIVNNGNADF